MSAVQDYSHVISLAPCLDNTPVSVVHLQNLDFQALEETTEYDGGYNRDCRIIKYVKGSSGHWYLDLTKWRSENLNLCYFNFLFKKQTNQELSMQQRSSV